MLLRLLVSTISNSNGGSILGTSTINVTGQGFSVTGGNTIELVSADDTYWLFEGSGLIFTDNFYVDITAEFGNIAAGQYSVYVRNGYDGNPSAAFSLTVN